MIANWNTSLVGRIDAAWARADALGNELYDAVLEIAGHDPASHFTEHPFQDVVTDIRDWDSPNIEVVVKIRGAVKGFDLTMEQLEKIWQLGCDVVDISYHHYQLSPPNPDDNPDTAPHHTYRRWL